MTLRTQKHVVERHHIISGAFSRKSWTYCFPILHLQESLRECVNKIEAMIRNGQSHCESPDKAKGQSVVEEDDDDEEGPPGPTMTSTPIKSAESGASSSSNGQGSGEEQQAALSGDKSNSTTSSSRRAVPGKSASGGYSIQEGSMEVDVSTPTEMYKVSAYCVT